MKDEYKVAIYVIAAVVSLYAAQALLSPLSPYTAHGRLVERGSVYAVLAILVFALLRVLNRRRQHEELLRAERDKSRRLFSERECAEEARAACQQRARLMMESSPDAITVTDLNGIVTDCNQATLALHGFSTRDEAIGRSALDFIAPEQHERALENMKRTLKDGVTRNLEYTLLRKDGGQFDGELSASVVRGGAGDPIAFIAVTKDITEVREAKAALERSRRRFEAIFEGTADGIVIVDPESKIVIMGNRVFAEMLGYRSEEVPGLEVTAIHPDEDRVQIDTKFEAVRKGKADVIKDRAMLRKDGTIFYADLNPALIELDGKTYVITCFRDVTDRRQAEQEKREMQAQLLQAQKMEAIGRLAGGIAHDFNNLLATILGYSDLAMRKIEEGDDLYEDLRRIADAGSCASDLTRQLLLFSRQQPMQVSPLDINQVVSDIMRMLRRLIGEDVHITADLAPDLPRFQGDRGNLEQVLMNLVINARDAMPDGGEIAIRTETVALSAEQCAAFEGAEPGRHIRLSVRDQGTGMDDATLEHIFEPFFTTKDAGRGTGLGLSVVYGIVSQHGGWVDVESKPGQGSTFNVYFGVMPVDSGPGSAQVIPQPECRGNGERILVVEDDDQLRDLASRMLREHGYRVFGAASAGDAIEVFRREGGFDIVFSDVVLPDKTALSLANELQRIMPDVKFLFSSGYTDDKSQRAVIKERGFNFLPKPYTMAALLQGVKNAVEAQGAAKPSEKELQPIP